MQDLIWVPAAPPMGPSSTKREANRRMSGDGDSFSFRPTCDTVCRANPFHRRLKSRPQPLPSTRICSAARPAGQARQITRIMVVRLKYNAWPLIRRDSLVFGAATSTGETGTPAPTREYLDPPRNGNLLRMANTPKLNHQEPDPPPANTMSAYPSPKQDEPIGTPRQASSQFPIHRSAQPDTSTDRAYDGQPVRWSTLSSRLCLRSTNLWSQATLFRVDCPVSPKYLLRMPAPESLLAE